MEVGGGGCVCGGGWGQQAGEEGAASLTQNCSLFGLHHIHLSDPLPLRPGKKREGGGGDRERRGGHREPGVEEKKNESVWVRIERRGWREIQVEKEREREGGGK